jgi:hypothetical protein
MNDHNRANFSIRILESFALIRKLGQTKMKKVFFTMILLMQAMLSAASAEPSPGDSAASNRAESAYPSLPATRPSPPGPSALPLRPKDDEPNKGGRPASAPLGAPIDPEPRWGGGGPQPKM